MSLASSPDHQMRAEDKALKLLFPTIEDSVTNSFDDYINQVLHDLSDDDKEEFFIGDVGELGELFDNEAFSSGASSQSPIGASARHKESSPQPWRKGLWCLNQNEPSVHQALIEEPRRAARAQNQLKLLNQPLYRSDLTDLRSPPPTPSAKGTKRFGSSPKAATTRPGPYGRQTFSREVTLSPTPMYSRLPNGNVPHQETWQQDFQNFHLQVRDDGLPLSPPSSGRLVQHENAARMNALNVAQNHGQLGTPLLMMPNYDMNQAVPSVENLDSELYVPRRHPTFVPNGPTMISSPTDQNVFPPQYSSQSQIQTVPNWSADTINKGHNTDYPYEPQHSLLDEGQDQEWWSPPPHSANPLATPNYTRLQEEFYPQLAVPSPQRPVHHLISSAANELQAGGLMIQHLADEIQPKKSDHNRSGTILSATVPSFSPPTAYPPLPPLETESYSQALSPTSPLTTPRRRNIPSPDRSASISPTNTSRSIRQTSPTRSTRRKSMGNPKASGVSKTPRTPRTPKTQNGGFEMNFVNLTAADSAKLLSDVAPSGSSKTRARREQEAKERRRRLSEAAVKAVRKAGGDVKALEQVIST